MAVGKHRGIRQAYWQQASIEAAGRYRIMAACRHRQAAGRHIDNCQLGFGTVPRRIRMDYFRIK